MIKKYTLFVIIICIHGMLMSQEYLTGLMSNPALKNQLAKGFELKSLPGIKLPFFDDFTNANSPYPDSSRWADNFVYVNTTYPVNAPTVGVATFDVLNDTGAVYPFASATPFIADFLTSKAIRLDSSFQGPPAPITIGDSIYLSFYYQPQGTADAPTINDSLLLEFYSPDDNKWNKVWASKGMTLVEFQNLNPWDFKQVLIPITKPAYLRKDFKFRFKNYGSIAPISIPSWQSNVDQWNIDYVYLNIGRTKADSTYADIGFADNTTRLFTNFTRIPVRHFTNAALASNFLLKETNLNTVLTNMGYDYYVTQDNGPFTASYTGGVEDINPFITNGYHTYAPHANPSINFTIPNISSYDTTAFTITHVMKSNGFTDIHKSNDTIRLHQEFSNCYAYDDGSAENGYGVHNAASKAAYAFTLNQSDTLGGIQFYFNETLGNPYYKYFNIMVWSSLSPENLIYKSKRVRPEFEDSLHKFHTYIIDDTNLIVSGTIYVGWQQTSDENLNVGFDRNTNSKQHTFYNTEGEWMSSEMDGSLMIRPIMGTNWHSKKMLVGPYSEKFTCNIYPNPADNKGYVTIALPENFSTEDDLNSITIEVFDCYQKRLLMKSEFNNTLDVSFLNKGVYFFKVTNFHANKIAVNKVIIY